MVSKLRDICGLFIVVCMLKKTVKWDMHLFFLSKADIKIKRLCTNFYDNVLLEGSTLMDRKKTSPAVHK